MTVYRNSQFIPTNNNARLATIQPVSTQNACACQCYADTSCITASFNGNNRSCILYFVQLNQGNLQIIADNLTSVISFRNRTTNTMFQGNWLTNGDAETGPCESSNNTLHPTSWNYNNMITQVYYNNTYGGLTLTDPGPSNRGNCHFYGQASLVTTMWQTGNITSLISPLQIDNHTVRFNFSAWIGGFSSQADNAQASLTFFNQTNQTVGNITTLGPVSNADRSNITSLLFRQANELVPVGARFFNVLITMTRIVGQANDGYIDNIVLVLHQ